MGNVLLTTDPDNADIITIDISRITDEQRRLLKKCIKYVDGSDIPLVVALMADSMKIRKQQVFNIILEEGKSAAMASAEEIINDL